jgi:hypothetical protein
MSDDEKSNAGKFNKVSDKTQVEDTRTVAGKDGTGQYLKPSNTVSVGAAGYSPMGTIAVKGSRDVKITVTSEDMPDREVPVLMDRSDINLSYKNNGFTVLVRRDDERSAKGIEGGHISRLTLAKGDVGNEEILAHYDNGQWMKEPQTFLAKQAVMEAKKQDNGITVSSIQPTFSKTHDPDLDI